MENEKLNITVNGVPYYKLEDIEEIILARLKEEKKDNNLIGYSDDYKQGFEECEHSIRLALQHIEDAERVEGIKNGSRQDKSRNRSITKDIPFRQSY